MASNFSRFFIRKDFKIKSILSYIFLFAGAWVMMFPFIWLISSSMKPEHEIFNQNWSFWPKELYIIENYYSVFFEQDFIGYLMNSLIVCILILVVQIITSIPCAYALAKLKFRGQNILFGSIILGLTIPINVTSIPIYLGIVKLGLLDTYFAMSFPFFLSVFAIFLFRQFFKTFPDSIIEAARIDGFTELEIIIRLIVPSAIPAIAAFSVFSFVAHWNDLYWPLIVVTSMEKTTATLSMMQYASGFYTDHKGAFAAATAVTLPMVIAFLFARKLFIRGITMTGIKG
tara:strand:+ start:753 stop:1610 length:858 start_codon:yes stop_codon:yes gene_type:complete